MVLMLARFCVVVLGVGSAFGAGETARQPEGNIRQAVDRQGGLTITLFCERGSPVVEKVMAGLRQINANDPMMGEPKKGQGISANVVVRPGTPSKQVVAAIVVLLDAGIRTITVEVRK